MSTSTDYLAPWSVSLKAITFSTSAVLLTIAVTGAVNADLPLLSRIGLACGSPILLAACALTVVRGYRIISNVLLVERLLWTTRISLEGLVAAEVAPRALRGTLRLWGNGGLFSFSGWFWSKRLGRFRMFATDPRRVVVLQFRNRCVVISPKWPDEFVDQLKHEIATYG